MSHSQERVPAPHSVAAYIRLSRADLRDPGSLEAKFEVRKAICLRLAAQHGLPLEESNIHYERASGTSLAGRPIMRALLDRCKSGQISALITPNQDRVTRGGDHDRGTIKEALCAGKVTLYATEGVLTFNRDFGIRDELVFDIKAAVASFRVRDDVQKRINADFERLKKGEGHKTYAGYGFYRVSKNDVLLGKYPPDALGTYHKVEAEFPILLEIIRRVETEKVPSIVADLNRRRIPPPGQTRPGRGSTRWYNSSMYSMLRNPFYIGLLAQRSRVERGVGKVRLPKEEVILSEVKGAWEAVMSEDAFHAFEAGVHGHVHRGSARTGLLSGLLHCARLGDNAQAEGQPMRVINQLSYGCDCKAQRIGHSGSSVSSVRVEAWVQQAITDLLHNLPAGALGAARKPSPDPVSARDGLAGARRELTDKEQQAQDLILRESYFVGLLGQHTYEATARKTRQQLDALRLRVDELQTQASVPDMGQMTTLLEQVRRVGLACFWTEASRPLQRLLIEACLRRVDILPPPNRYVQGAVITWHSWAEAYAPTPAPFPRVQGNPQNLYKYQKQNRLKNTDEEDIST